MTRSQRFAALHRRAGLSARAVLVLPAVAGAALATGACSIAAVEADAATAIPSTILAAADDGALRGAAAPGPGPGALSAVPASDPVAGECEEAVAQVVAEADGDVAPSYEPDASVRLTGSGWCANGRLLQGEQTVRVRLVAVGGYASQGEALVPVTFVDGAFGASLRLGELYAPSERGPGGYYLSVTVDSRLYVGTAQFQIAEPALQPVDRAASEPTTAPEPAGAADGTDDADNADEADKAAVETDEAAPAPEPTREPLTSPEPVSDNGEPALQPVDQAASELTTAPEPVDDVEPSPEPTPEPTSSESPEPASPEPTEAPTSDAPSESAAPPDAPRSEPAPAGPPSTTSQPGGGGADGEQSAAPGPQDAPSEPGDAPETAAPAQDPESGPATDPGAGKGRPTTRPAAPVPDASRLDASNAGSLSGTRRGNIVSLILPSDKAEKDDWVAVFLFPEESTPGWTQVDSSNSVSIDVSNLAAGSYQLAVGDRDSHLLGWAQLEITTAAADTSEPARMTVGTASVPQPSTLGRDDWMLVSAGGLLLVGAASFLILAGPALTGRRR